VLFHKNSLRAVKWCLFHSSSLITLTTYNKYVRNIIYEFNFSYNPSFRHFTPLYTFSEVHSTCTKTCEFPCKICVTDDKLQIFMSQQISLNLPKTKFHGTALKNAQVVSWMQTDRVKHRDVLLKVLSANRAKL